MPLGQRSIEQSLPLGYRRSGLLGLAGYGRDALRALPGVAQEWAARQAAADAARAEATRGSWRAVIGENEPIYTEPASEVVTQPAGAVPKREDGMAVVVRTPPSAPPPGEPLPPSMRRGQRAIEGMPGSIRAGAFQGGPRWTGVGGGARTGAQMEQDLRARGLLAAENEAELASIDASEEARGNPMERVLQGRAIDLAYENMLPYGSESSIKASWPIGEGQGAGVNIRRPIGAPTIGEARAIEAKSAPQRGVLEMIYEGFGQIDKEMEGHLAQLRNDPRYAAMDPQTQQATEDKIRARADDAKRSYQQNIGLATGRVPTTLFKEEAAF